jgi:hypothetical protein
MEDSDLFEVIGDALPAWRASRSDALFLSQSIATRRFGLILARSTNYAPAFSNSARHRSSVSLMGNHSKRAPAEADALRDMPRSKLTSSSRCRCWS